MSSWTRRFAFRVVGNLAGNCWHVTSHCLVVVPDSSLPLLAMVLLVLWSVYLDVVSPGGVVDPCWSRDRLAPRCMSRGLCQWLGSFPG